MKLSPRTLDKLTGIITGEVGPYPYRTGPKIIAFFNALGWDETYGSTFGSRNQHARNKLEALNGSPKMRDAILSAFDLWGEPGVDCEAAARDFNTLLHRDGYRLAKVSGPSWFENGHEVEGVPHFNVVPIRMGTIESATLEGVSHATLAEHIEKCRAKIGSGDSAGAITNAYTLIEAVLKDLLRLTGKTFKADEGDIRALYGLLKEPLNLDPKEESLGLHLKTVLDGFQKLVGGLYATANKASDRHDRRHHPAPHHAKLVVNSAFALGDFLYDTYEYQRARRNEELAKLAQNTDLELNPKPNATD